MITRDLNHRRGTRGSYNFETPGDMRSRELSFVVKPSTNLSDFRVVDKNSLRDGEITISFNEGEGKSIVTVNMLDEDTYSLNAGNYFYDLDDLTGSITLYAGMFLLSADVQSPLDNLELIPSNCSRVMLLNPEEFPENSFVRKTIVNGKEGFGQLVIEDAKNLLGVYSLEQGKVDKEPGRGLSDINFTQQLKTGYDACITDRHTHANKSNLDSINQTLNTSGTPQFSQLGIGRACQVSWSLALFSGLTTRGGTYIDWEGGNARIRENSYNLEFINYDGTSLITTFRTGAAGNTSYKPLSTTGQSYKTVNVSANTTLTASDHVVLVTTSSSDKTITLPISGIADGTVFIIKKIDSGAGKVNVQGASGTIDGQAYTQISAEYGYLHALKSGGNYFIVGKMI